MTAEIVGLKSMIQARKGCLNWVYVTAVEIFGLTPIYIMPKHKDPALEIATSSSCLTRRSSLTG